MYLIEEIKSAKSTIPSISSATPSSHRVGSFFLLRWLLKTEEVFSGRFQLKKIAIKKAASNEMPQDLELESIPSTRSLRPILFLGE
jgi:hypothetical protein